MVHQLGDLLRRRREELDLSQREVAERVGVSHTTIARVETGRRRISLELFQRVQRLWNFSSRFVSNDYRRRETAATTRKQKRSGSAGAAIGV
jgi:transcriptional regulator with XRE-family HTH domain